MLIERERERERERIDREEGIDDLVRAGERERETEREGQRERDGFVCVRE